MSDPKVIAWLRKIDANISEMRAERDLGFAEIHEELEVHEQHIARLDDCFSDHKDKLADHERRLARLEKANAARR